MRPALGKRGAYWNLKMQKPQEMIDIVLGDNTNQPRPQATSDVMIERDRRFMEVASTIQKLKQARLPAQARQ